MALKKIKNGLNLPITGEPVQEISNGNTVTKVALLGEDYVGLKPTMAVKVGDTVKLGQLLFTDKKMPAIRYTAPGSGKVVEINRGEKRVFKSIVIELNGGDEIAFTSYKAKQLKSLSKEKVTELLIESGLWTSIRRRPFNKVADPQITPNSIFVTAIDTNPLAPSIEKILESKENEFTTGLRIISKLTEGKVYLCKNPDTNIPTIDISNISIEEFSGPHPAGNVGTHIHFLDPVDRNKVVWFISVQDVLTVASLFTTGKISTERIISLAGPEVKNPRLIKTRIGASLIELTTGEISEKENRIISGSVLLGRENSDLEGYLGRFHQSVAVITEERERKFLGWLDIGINKFSVTRSFISSLFLNKKYDFTSTSNGQERAIIPNESYEKVMPLDIIPTFLLRSIAVDDVEEAEKLGCLELAEEDLALCTFVCPSKIDHGVNLRRNLTLIEKEG